MHLFGGERKGGPLFRRENISGGNFYLESSEEKDCGRKAERKYDHFHEAAEVLPFCLPSGCTPASSST